MTRDASWMYPGLVNLGNFVNFLDLDLPNTHVQPTVHTLLKWRQFYRLAYHGGMSKW